MWNSTEEAVERGVSEKPPEAKVSVAIDAALAGVAVAVRARAPPVIHFPFAL